MDAEDQGGGAYTDSDITGQVPLARFATPEDVATAVAFLADPSKSGFINGVALPVDGGWAVGRQLDLITPKAAATALKLGRPPVGPFSDKTLSNRQDMSILESRRGGRSRLGLFMPVHGSPRRSWKRGHREV